MNLFEVLKKKVCNSTPEKIYNSDNDSNDNIDNINKRGIIYEILY